MTQPAPTPAPAPAPAKPSKLKTAWTALWVAVTSEKARKLETALIVVAVDAVAKALGIKV